MALFSIVTAANTTITLDGSNGVTVTQAYGMGMPPMSNQVTDYAVLDGGSFQRAQAKPRVMMLQIEASGNALTGTNGLHTIRARLLSALNPHRAQPMRLNYTGNSGTRYINAYYEAGLDGGDLAGFTEQMTLRLLAPDPYWKANTATATTMANRAAQVFNHVGSWTDGVWSSMGGGWRLAVAMSTAWRPSQAAASMLAARLTRLAQRRRRASRCGRLREAGQSWAAA